MVRSFIEYLVDTQYEIRIQIKKAAMDDASEVARIYRAIYVEAYNQETDGKKLGSLSMLSARIKKRHSQSLTYHLPHGCVVDVFMSLGEVVLMKHFIILEMLNCALGWQ